MIDDLLHFGDAKARRRFIRGFLPMSFQPLATAVSGEKSSGEPTQRAEGPQEGAGNVARNFGADLKAAIDEFRVGLLGQYWQRVYKDVAEKGPVAERPWWEKAFVAPIIGGLRRVEKPDTSEQSSRMLRGKTMELIDQIGASRRRLELGLDSDTIFRQNIDALEGRSKEILGQADKLDDRKTYNWIRDQFRNALKRAEHPRFEFEPSESTVPPESPEPEPPESPEARFRGPSFSVPRNRRGGAPNEPFVPDFTQGITG